MPDPLPRPHVETTLTPLSPWVTVVARAVSIAGGPREVFHSLAQADYVTVLALTADGQVPLVRQYRPAIDGFSLELPGGLLDPGEAPETCARRELEEEVGLTAPRLVPLGVLEPDTGRLGNRLHGYFAPQATPLQNWQAEPGIERLSVARSTFLRDVAEGRFTHALHVALVGIALLRGLI